MSSHRDSSSIIDLNAPLLSREQRESGRSARVARPADLRNTNTTDGHDDDLEDDDDDDRDHDHDHSGDLDLDLDVELTSTPGETTGFQPPDRKELATMIVSGTVVVLLSVAAGLTTVFDWVL